MSLIELLDVVQSIWYSHQSEDHRKRPEIKVYDVKAHIEHLLNQGVKADDLLDQLNDYQPSEIDDIVFLDNHSKKSFDAAYDYINEEYRKTGHLDAVAFVNADKHDFDTEEKFNLSAKAIAVALGLDVSPELVPEVFWTNAFNNELTPLETAERLLSSLGTV